MLKMSLFTYKLTSIILTLINKSKGWFIQKFCHHLITLKLLQTCMSLFLLPNTKEDVLKNVGN